MNQNETACSARISNPCAPVINTENTDTRTGKPALHLVSVNEEAQVEDAVNFLISAGWFWEPTDPGRWGLFPGYGRADQCFK
jgi:hypothetical protein